MNWSYRAFWLAVMASMVTLMMTACGKKNDTPSIGLVGNVTVDSYGVNSNTSLDGYPVNFTLTSINRAPYNGGGGMGYNPYNTNVVFQNMIVGISVNGIPKTYTIVPNATTNGAPPQGDMVGNFQIYADARCTDQNCDNSYVVLWLGIQNMPEWKELGVYKSFVNGQIGSAVELQGSVNSLVTIDTMVQQLQQAYANK